jgi:hypothetical protein
VSVVNDAPHKRIIINEKEREGSMMDGQLADDKIIVDEEGEG